MALTAFWVVPSRSFPHGPCGRACLESVHQALTGRERQRLAGCLRAPKDSQRRSTCRTDPRPPRRRTPRPRCRQVDGWGGVGSTRGGWAWRGRSWLAAVPRRRRRSAAQDPGTARLFNHCLGRASRRSPPAGWVGPTHPTHRTGWVTACWAGARCGLPRELVPRSPFALGHHILSALRTDGAGVSHQG